MRSLALAASAFALLSFAPAQAETPAATAAAAPSAAATAPSRTVDLRAPNGAARGRVTFWAAPTGVLIRIQAQGLTPGWHGLHLHQTGDCSGPAFASAGPHISGEHHGAHGLLSPTGPEAGDLPNLFVGADGRGSAEVFTRAVAMNAGAEAPALLDADGSALVVHASADDQTTQPTGGSGDRVACAALR
jgi:Cu-Zn family superoxide dismutase